jgi:DNA-binding IclR family transcriptional regulator
MRRKIQTSYSVPALDKGLDIVEALAAAQTPQSLTEIAKTLKRSPSELFRMLNTLEKRSYISRDPVSERYRLTLKLYELAHTHSPVEQLLRAASLPMRELAESIHESCHLSVLSRQMLVVIAQEESPEPVRLSVEVGYRVQPLNTASGRVLIAFLGSQEQQYFLAGDKVYAEMTTSEKKALRRELEQIRANGHLMTLSTRRTGYDIACIAGNPETGAMAALAVPVIPGGTNAGKEKQLIPAVRKCAQQITAALGVSTPL